MKLNLVADYEVGQQERFVTTFSIDGSNNLALLTSLTSLQFPNGKGGFDTVAPTCLQMVESRKKAVAVEAEWKATYRKEGRLYGEGGAR